MLSTTRYDVFQKHAEEGNNIFAFWHSRLFYLVHYYMKGTCRRKVSVLISMSRDGDYGAAVARMHRHDVVRGSTGRGGQKAVRALAARAAAGNNIAITPDGPRGPAFTVNEGVIKIAQLTGARIIPVSYDATHKIQLRSWDRFILVKPYGRVHMAFGEPMSVPKHLQPKQLEDYRLRLEQALLELDSICTQSLRRTRKT